MLRVWNSFTYHTQSKNHTTPEQHIVQQCPASDPFTSLHHNDRHLQHHGEEAVASELSGDAAHDQLMRKCRDEERDERSKRAREMVLRCAVDVPPEEVVHGNVPFAGKFKPIT